jgi:hypothetical protein
MHDSTRCISIGFIHQCFILKYPSCENGHFLCDKEIASTITKKFIHPITSSDHRHPDPSHHRTSVQRVQVQRQEQERGQEQVLEQG